MADLTFGQSFGLAGAQGVLQLGNTMLQNYYNKQMAQYQNDFNLEMWNRQNEYNSPKETMNRLVDAGINPRAYQEIGQFANAGTPQQAAQMSKTSELSAFQSVVRQGLENQLLSEKVKQERSKTNLFDEQLGTVLSQKNKNFADTLIKLVQIGADPSLIGGDLGAYFGKGTLNALADYVKTGEQPVNPYLLAHFRKSLQDQGGYNLRNLEYQMKNLEYDDFKKHGIRGNSDYINLFRFIKSLAEK